MWSASITRRKIAGSNVLQPWKKRLPVWGGVFSLSQIPHRLERDAPRYINWYLTAGVGGYLKMREQRYIFRCA